MARALSVLHLSIFWVLFRRDTTKKAAMINIPFAFETDNNTCGIRNILLQHKCSIHTTSKLLKHDALKSDDTVEEEKSRWTFPLTQRQYYSRSTWRINIVSYYLVMQRAQKANEKLDDASLFYSGSKYYIQLNLNNKDSAFFNPLQHATRKVIWMRKLNALLYVNTYFCNTNLNCVSQYIWRKRDWWSRLT